MSGRFGAHRIVPRDDGTFEINGNGRRAAILAVHDDAGEMIDMVAWLPARPAEWWLRLGDAVVLGDRQLESAKFWHDAIDLFATPAAWLEAKGRGCCILRWTLDPRVVFGGVSKIICRGEPVARRLREELQKRWLAEFEIKVTRHAA